MYGRILKMECECFDWIQLAHVTDQWWGSCNLCTGPYVSIKGEFIDRPQEHLLLKDPVLAIGMTASKHLLNIQI
jgi:hypothetical protein